MADIESLVLSDAEIAEPATCDMLILRAAYCVQNYGGAPRPQTSYILEHLMAALQQYRQMEAEEDEEV